MKPSAPRINFRQKFFLQPLPIRCKLAQVPTDQRQKSDQIKLDMTRSVITEPLLSKVTEAARDPEASKSSRFDVIISINELFSGGIDNAMKYVFERAKAWNVKWYALSPYIFACLTADQLLGLAEEARKLTDENGKSGSVVYRIWEDQEVSTTLTRSLSTVKADAAQRAFQAFGEGIVWAVLDCGINGLHPHFAQTQPHFRADTDDMLPLVHKDYTPAGRSASDPNGTAASDRSALEDHFGHGSHVAGIIAGLWEAKNSRWRAGCGYRSARRTQQQAHSPARHAETHFRRSSKGQAFESESDC